MNLSQIVTAVRANTGRQDKDDAAKTAVTLALKRLAARYVFRMTVQTVDLDAAAGSLYITLPTDFLRLIAAYWINGTQSWPLLVKTREWVSARVPEGSAMNTSQARWAYLEGNKLKFVPGTTDDGIIRITYQPTLSMVDDSDENPVAMLDEALISFATGWVFASIHMLDIATYWYNQANQAFMDMMLADQDQPAIRHVIDERGSDDKPFIEPYLDPFAGFHSNWWN